MRMVGHEVDTILSTLRIEADPELSYLFDKFEHDYENKLWHQLTQNLNVFFMDERSKPLRLRVYDTFIVKFQENINELSLVQYLLVALQTISDSDEALKYLTHLKQTLEDIDSKKTRNDGLNNHDNAFLFIDIEIARLYLHKKELLKARDMLDVLEKTLDFKDNVPLLLTSSFYSANAEYYKLKEDFSSFYYTSLLYLSTLEDDNELTIINKEPSFELAYDLCVAALLGEKIYNFGELLQHPIMNLINERKDYHWIADLLNALTVGDLEKFDKLISVQLPKTPILAQNETFLRQKIRLMSLVECIFAKNIRLLSFQDVADATQIEKDQVEHLVIKAISLKLLKGSIDQVNELVTVTWVQPRIINEEQILKMKNRLVDWDEQVRALAVRLEERGKPIWV